MENKLAELSEQLESLRQDRFADREQHIIALGAMGKELASLRGELLAAVHGLGEKLESKCVPNEVHAETTKRLDGDIVDLKKKQDKQDDKLATVKSRHEKIMAVGATLIALLTAFQRQIAGVLESALNAIK